MKLASSYTTSKFRFTEKKLTQQTPIQSHWASYTLALLLLSLKHFSSATQRHCTALSTWREIAQGLSLSVAFWIWESCSDTGCKRFHTKPKQQKRVCQTLWRSLQIRIHRTLEPALELLLQLPAACPCLSVCCSNKGWGGRGVGLMHHDIAWHICCLSWQLARIFFGALQLCRVASRRIFLALRQFYSNHSLLDQALGLRMRE